MIQDCLQRDHKRSENVRTDHARIAPPYETSMLQVQRQRSDRGRSGEEHQGSAGAIGRGRFQRCMMGTCSEQIEQQHKMCSLRSSVMRWSKRLPNCSTYGYCCKS